MRKIVIVMLFIWAMAHGALAQDKEATYGTINILISDINGTILVTDSRLTAEDDSGRYWDNGQKLFELDSNTVCSFAGFASDPGLFPELSTETGGLIRGYSEALLAQSLSPRARRLPSKKR